jgi:predicted esterase
MLQSCTGFRKCLLLPVLSVILLLGISGRVMAQDVELRTLFCPIISEAPTIDGVVNEDEWSESAIIDELTRSRSSVQTEESGNVVTDTIIRIMADESTVYVALICGGPDGKPKNPQKRERDGFLATDNIVQVFVDLNHDHKSNKMFGVDYFGAQADSANPGTGHKGGNDIAWDAEWQAAAHQGESDWSVEIAIPFRELTGASIEPGTTLGINFIRRRPDVPCIDYMMTSPIAKSRFYWSHIFADVVCGPPGVVVSKIDLPVWRQGANAVGLELRNHGTAAETVDISARASSNAGGEEWEMASATVEPGSAKRVELNGHVIGDWGNEFALKVARAQSGEQLYAATYSKLNFGAGYLSFEPQQAVDESGNTWGIATSVDVRLQPDPYTVTLAPANGAKRGGALSVETEIMSDDSGELVSTEQFSLSPGSKMRAEADTSGLADGGYVFRTTITQNSGEKLLETGHYFVCVGQEYADLKSDLAELQQSIEQHKYGAESLKFARSSFMFLEYLVEQAGKVVEEGTIADVYSTSAFRNDFANAQEYLTEAKKLAKVFANDKDPLASKPAEGFESNADPLAGKTGVIQRAYFSNFSRELRPYTVFVPSTYDPSKPTPLISYNLSSGPTPDWRVSQEERGRVRSESLALAEAKGYIMVWPTNRRLEAEVNFFDVLEEMKKDYNIDEDRIYLMGVSGGGLASWLIGLRFPDQIAAICPISTLTVVSESTERPGLRSKALLKERSAYYFPMNALHVPVIMLHGDADTSTLCELQARPMAKKMNELGLELEYIEYPGVGHGLGHFYADGFAKALDFFDKHCNVRHPKTIDYSTPSIRYNKAYWIKIGKFSEKGKFARVQAEAKGSAVEVKTENVAGFAVLRDAEVFDVSAPVTVVIDGENVFDGRFPETGGLGFVKNQEGIWQAK